MTARASARRLRPAALSSGREGAQSAAQEVGRHVVATSLDEALIADIIFFAVQFVDFKTIGKALPDWTGKIVVDMTNAAFLPQEVQDRELQGRLSSEVNAERVPGAKWSRRSTSCR